jgi:hypothetical protein
MTTITGGKNRDGRVRDDSTSATPVALIVVPGRGLRVTRSTWARAHRKKVV